MNLLRLHTDAEAGENCKAPSLLEAIASWIEGDEWIDKYNLNFRYTVIMQFPLNYFTISLLVIHF